MLNFLVKLITKRKFSNKQFHHCEANIFLENVTKSINSQTNLNSSGNDSLTAKLYKRVSNELSPILKCLSKISNLIIFTFINPGKILAPCVSALEQESDLSHVKKVIKKRLQTIDRSHSSLDAIIFHFQTLVT